MGERVRIGILGCARIAKSALIDVARIVPEIEVAAIASRGLARGAAFAREHGVPRAYGNYESLLADPDIEAVYNPLPNSLHADWSIRALEAGKAVLCEKPLAANAQHARRMVDAAQATGLPLVEAFHYRYHPLGIFIAELVRSGRLGQIRAIDAGLLIPGALVPPDDIRFQNNLAGGATMDVGAYCINALRLVAGEEPQIEHASASVVSPEVDGAMRAKLRFSAGAAGTFQCSLIARELRAWLTVQGEFGRLEVNNPFLPQLGHRLILEVDGQRITQEFDRTPTYVFQAREFAKVVREKSEIRTDARDAVANMTAIDSVYRAAGMSPRR